MNTPAPSSGGAALCGGPPPLDGAPAHGTEARAADLLRAQPRQDMEWWYYHGHLRSQEREFGFCLAFFRARTASRDVAWPVRLAARVAFSGQYYPAHFSLTDERRGEFLYAHRRSIRGQAGSAGDRYHVWSGDWSAREEGGEHHLNAHMRDAALRLSLQPAGPLIAHGRGGRIQKEDSEPGLHLSYTRMLAAGALELAGRRHEVTGTAWMDREIGGWRLFHSWDWCGIQLDDGRDLAVSVLRDRQGQPMESAFAAIVQGGQVRRFAREEFSLRPRRAWKSPRTGVTYPAAWTLEIPAVGAALDVDPVMNHQELDTRGSTMILYWEGRCRVRGQIGGAPAAGAAYVELLGYDQTHLHVTLADWIRGELLLHRHGRGRVVRSLDRTPPAGSC